MILTRVNLIFFGKISLHRLWQSLIKFCLLPVLIAVISLPLWHTEPAYANIDDDRYEGNVFILFAGNGSLVPPRFGLAESLQRKMPTILVFYVDDSSDCKQFSGVVSRLQQYYDRNASIIPVSVDSIPLKSSYTPQEPGYYYQGIVPQTVILDQQGKVLFNKSGQIPYEEADDILRKVFDLLPRDKSVELKRRSFNQFNSELVD